MSATPVAFIVAETVQQARDAAEAVEVDYDMLPALTDLRTAMDAGSAQVWPDAPNNICFDWEIGDKDQDEALFVRRPRHQADRRQQPHRGRLDGEPAWRWPNTTRERRFTLRTNTQGGWVHQERCSPTPCSRSTRRSSASSPPMSAAASA